MSAKPPIVAPEWLGDQSNLPTERDFDPWGGNLDAQTAWKNLGGLSRQQAYDRFLENPLFYQEDFMFMGGKAFAYYYPVIERFLYDADEADQATPRHAWILAEGISLQFQWNADEIRHLASRVVALANHVRAHLAAYDSDMDEQQRIAQAWDEVERTLQYPG